MLGIKDGPIEKKAMVIDMKINITREFSYEMAKKIWNCYVNWLFNEHKKYKKK